MTHRRGFALPEETLADHPSRAFGNWRDEKMHACGIRKNYALRVTPKKLFSYFLCRHESHASCWIAITKAWAVISRKINLIYANNESMRLMRLIRICE
jgi:hypothetical protein